MKFAAAAIAAVFLAILTVSAMSLGEPSVLCEIDRARATDAPPPVLDPLTPAQWEVARAITAPVEQDDWQLMAIGITAGIHGSNLTTTVEGDVPVTLNPFTGRPTLTVTTDIIDAFYAEVTTDPQWADKPPLEVVRWVLGAPGARLTDTYEQAILIVAELTGADGESLLSQINDDASCLGDSEIIGDVVTIDGITWPVPGHPGISSRFGYRVHPISGIWKLHAGVDIGAPCGASIVPVKPGLVVTVDENAVGYGTLVEVLHEDNNITRYAHMYPGTIVVREGDRLQVGQRLAYVGSAGTSTACHLHIELKNPAGQLVDPGKAFGWY